MLEDVSLCFLQTRISYSRIRGSYPFRRRARCTAADVDDISTPRRSAAARARETSQHQQNASDIIFNADFTVDHSLAASLIRPRRGRRGRVAPVIRDTSNRPLQELQRKYQGPAIPQAEEQNLDSLQQRGSPSQPGPDPLSQTQTHQKPITAPGSSPLRTRSKDHGNLPSQISPQCSALAVDGKAMEGASHLPECTPWRGEGVSMSGKNSRLSAAPSQKAQQQRSGGGLAPPPPPLVPAPMGGGMGPPAGSVMSGWALAGGQPQMNSVYRLIRKKELQHNYNHRHYPDQYVSERGANNSDDGGGELQQSRTGMSAPLSQRPPVRGSPGARDVSPRLGDVRRHRQMPPTQPKLQLQPQPQSPQRDDAQQRQRQGDGQASEGHVGSRLDSSLRPPPAALLAPFSSGHAAVDRVVRIRQIEMQRRQRRRNTDGDGGGGAGDGTNSCWDYGSRQASSWDARPPAGFGAGPASAATPTYVAPIAREGVWAIDKVPTALLGGRSGSVWGHGGSERKPDGGGGTDGAGDRNVIQVILASPSGVGGGGGGSGSGGGGGGRGGDDGEGSSVSSLLRETLMSDLSLLNPVYRMIRKHELLQRHPHPAAKASGSGSCSPSAAGTASPFISSPASSLDPWATDDFADVMLGGLMLTPPPPPPTASDQECISKSESGSGSIFRSGSAEAVSGTARSSRHAASDTASAVQAPGRLNPVLRLIRKKQLQRRLRLRGRLVPEIPTSAATTARSAPVTVGASDNVTATDGGDDAFSHASRSRGTAGGAGSGSGSSGSGDTIEEAAAWEIGPADAVGGRAVLNPVYRLIRKKQLQSKRASREAAAAAAAAAATADSSGRGGPGSDPAGLSPFRVAKDTGGETTTWQPRRAPFFDLGFGDYYGSFRSPASTLADALDPMAARSGSGSGPLPGLESDFMAASGNERDVVIQIDNTAAAGSAEPLVLPPASSLSSPSPQLLGSRVSDQLTSSMVGERPHMNHVYRLIRKKELQLRQRGVLPREAPAAATPVEGSTSAVHGDGRNGGGGGADVDASISNVRSAPVLLPLPLPLSATVVRPAASVRPSSGPPALLHPFDPVDDQDGVAVSGMGPAGTLMGYSSRLLMGGTYDEEQDEVYGDAGDDEGTFWSATSEEDSGDELDEHSEVLSSSRKNSLGLAPLALGRWPQADAKQHEAVLGQGLKARAVDAIETYTTSDATETPQGLRVQRRRRRKQEGKKVKVSEEGEEEREREKAVVVQDSSVVQMGLAVREGEEPDGKEATAAAAVVEAASYSKGKGQSQRQQFKRSHADALTGSAVAATATATVTALDGCLESTSTSRQHASGRRGRSRSRNDQDALLVAAGKESTVAADTSVAAASITKSSGDGHGGGLGDGVPCGVALITPRRRRIEELKASLRAKLLRLATTGGGGSGGGGGSANTNRTPQLLSGPSQRHYQSPPLSPPASPEAAAFAATKVRHEGSLPSAETAGACGCADALGATTSSAAAMAAVATDASRGAAASNTKDLDHSASITAVSRPHASGSVAAPPDDDIEREPAPAVTARPLPWQLTRRSSAATGGSASSFANGRSGIQIRRTGTAHRPPGLLRFLLETSPGPDGAEFSYATQAAVQNARGLRPDDSGGGNGVSSTAVRAPRRLFSGIAQLWDAVGLRVGPPPPTLPQADLDAATAAVAAASGRDLAQLEKLLVQEGVTEA
ncbi:hypothetical protein Vretifemale_17083 [Volvox reticuliferus]|nr:hypothetical protein Vretifemale_17083 [Volvox reticuliferus]